MRAITFVPVTPSTRPSGSTSISAAQVSARASSNARKKTTTFRGSVHACHISSIAAVMRAGPAINGIASGKTAISPVALASFSSLAVSAERPLG